MCLVWEAFTSSEFLKGKPLFKVAEKRFFLFESKFCYRFNLQLLMTKHPRSEALAHEPDFLHSSEIGALHEREAHYRTLLNFTDDAFCVIEFMDGPHGPLSDYVHIEANPAYVRHSGIPNVVGKTVRQVLTEDEAVAWMARFRPVLETGEPIHFERRLEATDRYLKVSCYRIDPPSRCQVALLFKDVTAQRRYESERERLLKEAQISRDQLLAVFQQAPAFMCILRGPEHAFELVNERYMQLIGSRETAGKTVSQVLPEVIEQGYIKILDDVYITGKPFIGTGAQVVFQHRADGLPTEHFIDFIYLPWRGASGEIEGILLHGVDVTERKRAEEKLREADRRKDEFLAMLAHELRNPLAPIGAAAQLLQLVKLDEDRVRKTSAVIGRQVNHMTGLIDDLLDVSRVTRGLIELDKVALDIQHIVNDALEQVSPLIRSRGHELTIRLTPQSAFVRGDKKRLVQVLANVLNNAAKYTTEGGNLALRTVVHDEAVLIEVSDDGIGMTPETAKHAFDLFAQAERSSDRSSGGLGLGLALVKSLVELHGGTVTCKSSGLGQGSTFSLCLPRLAEPSQTGSCVVSENVALVTPAASLKILVVDDNVDAAAMLKMLLEAMGHQVQVEHGALRALEQAKLYQPQVCLVDIGLPEIDGNEVARRLRIQSENVHTLLVAVTGYGQESDRASTLAAGFDHHLVKPVDTATLTSVLSAISRG